MSAPVLLFQPPGRPFGLINLSPFCAKLETFLRMAAVPYETRPFERGRAPKGKMPYVELDGRLLGDTHFIIRALKEARGADLDAWLTPSQRAHARLVQRTVVEGLYFVVLQMRWTRDDAWPTQVEAMGNIVPAPVKPLVMPLIRRDVRTKVAAQGTGRHSDAEVDALGVEDVDALAATLGDGPFLFGNQPCSADATLFAMVDGLLLYPVPSAVKARAQSHANLVAYQRRIRDRWFQDLPLP